MTIKEARKKLLIELDEANRLEAELKRIPRTVHDLGLICASQNEVTDIIYEMISHNVDRRLNTQEI